MSQESDRDKLRDLLLERSFKLGDFTLSSGKKSEYYVDARTTSLHPEGALLIGRLVMPVIDSWNIAMVGGLTLGADPLVTAIAMTSAMPERDGRPAVPAFIVRKAEKKHGTGRRIEGCFDKNLACAIIEDTLTTGGSALQAVQAAEDEGAKVIGVIAVVDREEGGRQAIEARGLKLHALFTASELKAAAKDKG